MSVRYACIFLLTIAAGCSPPHVDPTGDGGIPLPPSGATPPLAGAPMVPTGASDIAGGLTLKLKVDASGDPLVVWQSAANSEIWSAQRTSSGWAAAALVGKDAACSGFDMSIDADGNATVWSCDYFSDSNSVHQLWRAAAGGAWAALVAATGGLVVPGPHGAILHLSTQLVKNMDMSQTVNVLGSQFAAAGGWSASSVIGTFSSQPYDSAEGKLLGGGILADGSALATWSQSIIPSSGGQIMEQLEYATRPAGGSWSTATMVNYANVSSISTYDNLFTDGVGDAIWLATAVATSPPMHMQSITFANGAWSPMQTFAFDSDVLQDYSATVGSDGTVSVVSTSLHGWYVESATKQSPWQRTDTDAQDKRYLAVDSPKLAADGQGGIVVGWINVANFTNPHIFCARYSTASGWSAPHMVDGDDNPGLAGAWALGTNDAGAAFVAWVKNGALWAAPIP